MPIPIESPDDVKKRIIYTLRIYPKISVAMLHVGIGTTIKTEIWRPILETLISEGIVHREFTVHLSPGGKNRTYTRLWLNGAL